MKTIFLIFLLFPPYLLGQDLTFYKEDITFTLGTNHFTVDGLYWFANRANKSCESLIYYPYGINSTTENVDSMEITNVSENSIPKIVGKDKNGFLFLLRLLANDTIVYHIKYMQNIASDSVRYILTSTQQWNRALEYADYKLIVDKKFIITKFSYKPDTVNNMENAKIYSWTKTNFMPYFDMVFHFGK
jgi:hypothetical protein